jgi:hypothetical protein
VTSRDKEPQPTLRSRGAGWAGRTPSARVLIVCAAAVVTALAAAAAAQSKGSPRLVSPKLDEISRAGAPIVDKQVKLSAVPDGFWGGQYKIASGELVTVYASNSYPIDPALGQRWADFLGSLVHGSEISSVTVLLATPSQISRVCGRAAVACYDPQSESLYTPGEDPASDLSAEAVITHEYGHHVAANRSNAPWAAVDYGPKRWASAMQVCAQTEDGQLFPGAENARQYQLNPGEAWAETYRVLNEHKAGVAETPWDIVSQSLYPSAAALTAAEQDVVSPWTRAATSTQKVTLAAKESRTFTVATPLDGSLNVTVRHSKGLRLSVDVFASSTRISHSVTTGTVAKSATVCGTRSYRVRVTDLRGRGSVSFAVAKP